MANIVDFKTALFDGGARANQFRVFLHFPTSTALGVVQAQRAQFLCKAATLPASKIENIQVAYRGRPVNFSGERIYDPWTITIYNNVDNGIRNAFESWQSLIQNYSATNGDTYPVDYQQPIEVHQLDRNGASTKSYRLIDAYPTEIGQIQLDYDDDKKIETFEVTFIYNYFVSNTGTDSDGSSFAVNVSVDTPLGTFPA